MRRLLNEKVGHTGTLDPMATGVLPLCVGKATQVAGCSSPRRQGLRGRRSRFGVETDTLDAQGKVLAERAGARR